jgi:hypothetical protein
MGTFTRFDATNEKITVFLPRRAAWNPRFWIQKVCFSKASGIAALQHLGHSTFLKSKEKVCPDK